MSVGINGMGRIGRLLVRALWERGSPAVVHTNDLNGDLENVAYLLRHDSIYGRFCGRIRVDGDHLLLEDDDRRWQLTCSAEPLVGRVGWADRGVELLVEATGVDDNHRRCRELVQGELSHVVISQRSGFADQTVLFGMLTTPALVSPGTVVSASTCDGVALAPVVDRVTQAFGLARGFVTTMHPWLSYQNVVDGPLPSVARRGSFEPDYALGRASPGALIPKRTSAVEAIEEHVARARGRMLGMSVRVPTPVVSYAVLDMHLERGGTTEELLAVLEAGAPHIVIEREPLVSTDYIGTTASATVDARFTSLDGEGYARVCVAYDNEWGYVQRLADVIQHSYPAER